MGCGTRAQAKFFVVAVTFIVSTTAITGAQESADLARAHAALEAGRRAEAERLFRTVIQAEPFRTEGHLGLAKAIAGQGRRLEAASVLIEVGNELLQSREYAAARDVLVEAVRLYPGSYQAQLSLGRTLLGLNLFEDASQHLRQAIERGDASLATRLYLGAALWENGDASEAERVYVSAVESSSNDPVALQQLGSLLLWQGRYDEAAAALGRAATAKPDAADLKLDWGKALEGSGRMSEALEAYRSAVALEPNMPQARYHLGMLLHRTGDTEEAEEELTVFRRLHDEDQTRQHEQRRRQAELNQAWHVFRNGDPAEAAARFRALPETPDSLSGLAASRSALGQHGSALEALERAVLLAPRRRDLRLQLAETRVAAGDP